MERLSDSEYESMGFLIALARQAVKALRERNEIERERNEILRADAQARFRAEHGYCDMVRYHEHPCDAAEIRTREYHRMTRGLGMGPSYPATTFFGVATYVKSPDGRLVPAQRVVPVQEADHA